MTIFVFSNFFAANMLLNNIDYVLAFQIHRIVLLKEIYNMDVPYNRGIKIEIRERVSDCIEIADMVFVIKNEMIPKTKIEYVKKMSAEKQKPLYEFFDPWYSLSFDNGAFEHSFPKSSKKPCVLSLFCGNIASSYYLETTISKIFSQNDICFKQIYSTATNSFLVQMGKFKLLNQKIERQLDKNYDNADIIGCSCVLDKNYDKLFSQIGFLRSTSPDFIILQVDYNLNCIEYIKDFIRYSFQKSIAITVLSRYICVEDEYCIYYNNRISCAKDELAMYDCELESILERTLFTQLAYPDDIRML